MSDGLSLEMLLKQGQMSANALFSSIEFGDDGILEGNSDVRRWRRRNSVVHRKLVFRWDPNCAKNPWE
ncbi:hypothetical protein Y032_0028g1764 [Ancylostoma ceylanicum]|uniref:Uncharacterized protein n=1 Tax=Ancylostoma ceylanicum TaxID=53326 RepID=A0A016UTW7_9BILA|nr:hypothetical protein Y032_0028g1764 [Ancylostoma ceylanicum]